MRSLGTIGGALILSYAVQAAVINVNPGFEIPLILSVPPTPYQTFDPLIKSYSQADVPGWTTTDVNGAIEIWRTGAQGFAAFEGFQWAEINAYSAGTLTAFVTPAAGTKIGLKFAHRGRGSATVGDVMRVVVTDMGTSTVLHTADYTATNVAWILHKVPFAAPATGNQLRLEMSAISTASGDNSVGNFVDSVAFGNIPEPSTWVLAFGGVLVILARIRIRRRDVIQQTAIE
jgi:hypothetical protein